MGEPSDGAEDPTLTPSAVATRAETERPGSRAASELPDSGYTLGEMIGRGGMGEVLLARDQRIGREVAFKRMREAAPSADAIARFLREARIQARLDHPSIVPVHELGRDDQGRPYFTMKRIAGITLAQQLEATVPPSRQRLLRAFADVCAAVEFAHSRGVVHRDLKPANVMLGDFNEVHVLDWGVARMTGERDGQRTGGEIVTLEGHTEAGALLGTPGYMAPEQIHDAAAVERPADVYALGAILFEILAGEPLHPRGHGALATTLEPTVSSPGARRPDRAIAPELDELCAAALAYEPAKRPTAHELAERVQHYLDGDRDLERRQQLAEEQLVVAREALQQHRRADAIRAAGRALALVPESHEAGELVSGLMLSLPAEPPPELTAAIEADELTAERRHARVASLTFLSILAMSPVVAWNGILNWTLIAGLMAFAAVMSLATWQISRTPARRLREIVMLVAGNAALVGLLSRVSGSFVLVPAIVCVMMMSLMSYRFLVGRTWIVIAVLVTGWAVPLGFEALGWVGRTWRFVDGELVTSSNAIRLDGGGALAVLVTVNLVAMVVAGLYAGALARSKRESQRQAVSQAWHLRQLLPA